MTAIRCSQVHLLSIPMVAAFKGCVLALSITVVAGCGGSNSSSSTIPSQEQGSATVRFIDGSPSLETIIAGVPQPICSGISSPCYLHVNGQTVTQSYYYGTITNFMNVAPGILSLVARTVAGYAVGPLKTDALAAGKRYTIIVAGIYPNYHALTFEEPATNSSAQVSLYEASPTIPKAAFGSFNASGHPNFRQLGTATYGTMTTVTVGKSVTNFGAYVGAKSSPIGQITPSQLNTFDKHNVLPFHAIERLSLFLFTNPGSTSGEVFGSLDR